MDSTTALSNLIRAFGGMHHQCIKITIQKHELDELSNPMLLHFIRDRGGVMSQKSIADYLGVAPPTIAVSIKRMQKAGLVRKKANQDDQRENFVELTEKGICLTDKCIKAFDGLYSMILNGLSEEETETLSRLLIRLIKNMEGLGAKNPGFVEERMNL